MKKSAVFRGVAALAAASLSCSSSEGPPGDAAVPEPCAAQGVSSADRFPSGDADGHQDPFGARAAKQARAGRVREAGQIRQPDNARSRARVGDYVLVNDRVAFYIEGARVSDGYSSLGGEIITADLVGDDGAPRGTSQYGETMLVLSRQAVAPERVTVLADGKDGKAAIVRVSGRLQDVPFLQESFGDLLPRSYNFPAALDYVLEPGAAHLRVRLSILNSSDAAVDFAGSQALGFFHSSRGRLYTASKGFDDPAGRTPYVIFQTEDGAPSYAFRPQKGDLRFLISASGFQYFLPSGFSVDACQRTEQVYTDLFVGAGLDGVLSAMRGADGDATWREVSGQVRLEGGQPAAGAVVHAVAPGESEVYLTQATADASGAFKLHLPDLGVQLVPTLAGHGRPAPVNVAAATRAVDLTVPRPGAVRVRISDADTKGALPARVQVIPEAPAAPPPAAWGVPSEANQRLHQSYVAASGEVTLPAPPGRHRVVVTRGYDYELSDSVVTVVSGQTVEVSAALKRSVDKGLVQCADFHIHSYYSADSSDPVEYKVRGAVADGLEIPVSSEHEWIIDFQPYVEKLGLKAFAFGMASEEFTTFTWGHFGIVPITPRPDQVNRGAVPWIGRRPTEVFAAIKAMPEQPVLIVNHPSGGGTGAYFSAAGFRRDTASGDSALWSDNFGAVEVFNDSDLEYNRERSLADWFALLNAGKVVWAVGSSDTHSLRSSPAGYPRTCLRTGKAGPTELSVELVRDTLRKGAATISGGLYMTVTGPGGEGPGAMLPKQAGPIPFKVEIQAPSWLSAAQLEVFVDGEPLPDRIQLQQTQDPQHPGPGRYYQVTVPVSPRRAVPLHYVVFHANTPGKDLSPLAPGRKAFAVSNPIFF